MRRRTLRENVDNVFGLGGQWRSFGQQRRFGLHCVCGRRKKFITKHRRETQSAKTHPGSLKKLPPCQKMIFEMRGVFQLVFVIWLIHGLA
jgi:hypothetical protein